MSWKHIIVREEERAVVSKDGRFGGILAPGEYRMFVAAGVDLAIETYNVGDLVFNSGWADYLADERPDLAERYFTRIETNGFEVAMVYVDGRLFEVMLPAKRLLFWRGALRIIAELARVIEQA